LFISTLLPLFAVVALLANALGWLSHRQWHRSLLGMIGPAIVFAGTVWLRQLVDSTPVYTGLALMIGVSIWDLVSPVNRRCGPDGCELPRNTTDCVSQRPTQKRNDE
jgi:mercuric ion transport protein